MKTLLLVIALVAKAEVPKTGLPEPTAATAAVARSAAFPEPSAVQAAEPAECRIGGAAQVDGARMEAARVAVSAVDPSADAEAAVRVFAQAAFGVTDGTCPPVALEDVKPIREAEPRNAGKMPEPKPDPVCSLLGIYERKRMLSGPWSASRRLRAARIRGDEDEAKRMEAMLGEFVGKAILDEEEGTGK